MIIKSPNFLNSFQIGLMMLIKRCCILKCINEEVALSLVDKGLSDHFKLLE